MVDPAQHAGRLLQPVEGDPAHQGLDLAHGGRGLDVVAHDVADDQHRVAVGLQEGVVPVAADRHALGGRPVPDRELEVVGLHRRGEQAQLQPLGHLLVGRGQPGVVERERGPAGGDLRRPQLGLGVRPALGPVDQGERAEDLAAGDQRERRDGRRPQRLQRPRASGRRPPSRRRCSGGELRDDHRPRARAACAAPARSAWLVATRRSA